MALLTLVLLGCVLIAFIVLRDNTAFMLSKSRRIIGLSFISISALASAWLLRWVTIMEVQTIAKSDAGLYPYQLSTDGNGWLGIVGMLGLWIALALLGSELIQPTLNKENKTTSFTLTER